MAIPLIRIPDLTILGTFIQTLLVKSLRQNSLVSDDFKGHLKY